ncbi:hypothetical protein [Sphingomonas asaccharolytica]|uniref:hypothetical protein n=1 Tax=Sphingomonas asaccharolytica TaxID=40681 RepID=UPI000B0617D1|nr:hypothetical protein [Sphingomonas asaccharolytica]
MMLDRTATGASPYTLALRQLLAEKPEPVAAFTAGDLEVELICGPDSLWAVVRREGRGGLAIRCACLAGPFDCRAARHQAGELVRLRIKSAMGEHVVALTLGETQPELLRVSVWLTPARPLLIPFLPRDLYPLDRNDDPTTAQGHVEAAQRGLNSGALFFRIAEPDFGTVLYFQNLTALNDYYLATDTKPDGAVGGEWPELGYLPPTPPQSAMPPVETLEAGKEIMLSDALIAIRDLDDGSEEQGALQFLRMLGVVYKALDRPETDFRDWVERSERTLEDLATAAEATVRHYGNLYAHPYTASEYPDCMVQLSLLSAIHDWGRWHGTPHPLEKEFRRGLNKFHDRELGTLRRYLPNVGSDKDKDAVDSWYLYHPLLNLAKLASDGDRPARTLFMKVIDYGIRVAHHFDYKWPIQFNVRDFSVLTATANDDRGQTDVGGLYAYVMLQAHALTDDSRFLHEARAAIDTAKGMRFNLNYQANLTAWGAAACMRLWRITTDDSYRDQSYVYLASFFHNCEIWESRIAAARHYKNFLGATCLQDAPYMAVYECFDSFAAFERYLEDSGPDLDPGVRMLVSEYCKYALDRAWYYYPDALPQDVLAEQQRNGHIARNLSFPLEDLYADGQKAGQVGQEIYGAGAAMIFATRSFHDFEDVPFRLYCNQFLRSVERTGPNALSVQFDGGEGCMADLCLLPRNGAPLPRAKVTLADGAVVRQSSRDGRLSYRVPASSRIAIAWDSD